jgi:hypothetical protein
MAALRSGFGPTLPALLRKRLGLPPLVTVAAAVVLALAIGVGVLVALARPPWPGGGSSSSRSWRARSGCPGTGAT